MASFKQSHNTYIKMVKRGKASTSDSKMDMKDYSEFLKSDFWKKTRRNKLKKNRRCFFCLSNSYLQVHHITYRRMFIPDKSQLIILCKKHHKAVEAIPFTYRNNRRAFDIMRNNCMRHLELNNGLRKIHEENIYHSLKYRTSSGWKNYFKKYPNGLFGGV